jgi:hypothetical protein
MDSPTARKTAEWRGPNLRQALLYDQGRGPAPPLIRCGRPLSPDTAGGCQPRRPWPLGAKNGVLATPWNPECYDVMCTLVGRLTSLPESMFTCAVLPKGEARLVSGVRARVRACCKVADPGAEVAGMQRPLIAWHSTAWHGILGNGRGNQIQLSADPRPLAAFTAWEFASLLVYIFVTFHPIDQRC